MSGQGRDYTYHLSHTSFAVACLVTAHLSLPALRFRHAAFYWHASATSNLTSEENEGV